MPSSSTELLATKPFKASDRQSPLKFVHEYKMMLNCILEHLHKHEGCSCAEEIISEFGIEERQIEEL
jgi:hypothetical protein